MVSFSSGILPEVVEVQVFQYRPSNLMILIGQKVAFQHITGSSFFVTSLPSIQAIKSYFKGSARKLFTGKVFLRQRSVIHSKPSALEIIGSCRL